MVNIWSYFAQAIGASCPLCHTPGDGICLPCLDSLPRNRNACPRCALPLADSVPAGTLCSACQRRPPAFDRALAPLLYRPPVDGLLNDFKHRHRLHLGRLLAEPLVEALRDRGARPALLLPVPAGSSRLRERGFNQAAELARWLALHLDLPCSDRHLLRVIEGGHQQGAGRRERRRNVRGAFRCRGTVPARVALVDDVMTTAATAEEAARVLRRAGAEHVEVWAVARTPPGGGFAP